MWGLDISEEMLRFPCPRGFTRGGIHDGIAFENGFFDAAYATESLSTPWKSRRR